MTIRDTLKLLLVAPNIDVNIEAMMVEVHRAVCGNNIERFKTSGFCSTNQPRLAALVRTRRGNRPVMVAVLKLNTCLALLAVDLRVDLDLTDKEGRSLEERTPRYFAVLFCIFKIIKSAGWSAISSSL